MIRNSHNILETSHKLWRCREKCSSSLTLGKKLGRGSVINLSCVIILLQICLACQKICSGICFHINSLKQDD